MSGRSAPQSVLQVVVQGENLISGGQGRDPCQAPWVMMPQPSGTPFMELQGQCSCWELYFRWFRSFLEMMHRGIYRPFRCVQLIEPRRIFRAKKAAEKPAMLWAGNLPLQSLSVLSAALKSRGGWPWCRDGTDMWRGLISLCLAINPRLFRCNTAFTAGKESTSSLGFPDEPGVGWLLESRPASPIMELISHPWALGCPGIKGSLSSWYTLRKWRSKSILAGNNRRSKTW